MDAKFSSKKPSATTFMPNQRVPRANFTNHIIRDSYSLLGAAGAVLRLLGRCRPATVLGQSVTPTTVGAVIVNSFNTGPIWPRSHVFKERRKRLPPVFADSDATSAIPSVAPGVRIAASLIHACPRAVLNRPPSGPMFGNTLQSIAAATDYRSASANTTQGKACNQHNLSAVTATYPASRGALIGSAIHHLEASVSNTHLVNQSSHVTQYIRDNKNHVIAAADHS